MRVLVTGGSGFIGSHIMDLLVTDGHEVVSVDNLNPAAHAGVPGYLNPAAEHRVVPLSDLAGLISAATGVDAVCHQAARVGLGVDFDDVTDYVNDNAADTATLLKALYRTGFCGRLVQAAWWSTARGVTSAPSTTRWHRGDDVRRIWRMAISSHRARPVGVPWPRPR